jgi:hypothetical protein
MKVRLLKSLKTSPLSGPIPFGLTLSENLGAPSLPVHASPYAPDRRRSRRNAAALAMAASSVDLELTSNSGPLAIDI